MLILKIFVILFFIMKTSAGVASFRDICKYRYTQEELLCANISAMDVNIFLPFEEDFAGFSSNLRRLEIQQSEIHTLVKYVFKNLPMLSTIILSNISIHTLEHEVFTGVRRLKWLDLSYNLIDKIPEDAFDGTNIGHLYLKGNRNLIIPTNGPIITAPKLLGLNLKACNIEHLSGIAFVNTPRLTTLDLSNNRLQMLPQAVFKNLPLAYLDLSYNNFLTLDISTFRGIARFPQNPRSLLLRANQWRCNCRLQNIIKWVTQNTLTGEWSELAIRSRLRQDVYCVQPKSIIGLSWNKLKDWKCTEF